jgi:hypothetical protein
MIIEIHNTALKGAKHEDDIGRDTKEVSDSEIHPALQKWNT